MKNDEVEDLTSHTQIQIRYGMILEQCIAEGLREAGFSFAQAYQYDPVSETPDFLVPNELKPQLLIETQQLGTRDSLRMKTLRLFTAVVEAKSHFGPNLRTANVILGDTDTAFAESAMRAASSLFDRAILLRKEVSDPKALDRIGLRALALAKTAGVPIQVAAKSLIRDMRSDIGIIAKTLRARTSGISANKALDRLWKLESDRRRKLENDPSPIEPTYLKRVLLQSVFISDKAFSEIASSKDLSNISKEVVAQLVATGIGVVIEEIDGDRLYLNSQFELFVRESGANELRELVRETLEAREEMRFFFEDIRNGVRRAAMVDSFLAAVDRGPDYFAKQLSVNMRGNEKDEIAHSRGWFVDLMAILSGKSFNHFNNVIFQCPEYSIRLWNPFSNMTMRTPSLLRNAAILAVCIREATKEFFRACAEMRRTEAEARRDQLANLFLKFRIDNAVKLRLLNPLEVFARSVSQRLGLRFERVSLDNLLCDVAADSGVGRFLIYVITDPETQHSVLFNALAAYENPKDKAKEWSARRIASLYRAKGGTVEESPWVTGVLLVDGAWDPGDLARLYRSGWKYIVNWRDLESALRSALKIVRGTMRENEDSQANDGRNQRGKIV